MALPSPLNSISTSARLGFIKISIQNCCFRSPEALRYRDDITNSTLYPLKRYLSDLDDGVKTRSCRRRETDCERAAHQHHSMTTPFDQLSTSDYSSNVSTSGSVSTGNLDRLQVPSPNNTEVQKDLWDTDSEGTLDDPAWEEEADAARIKADIENGGKCIILAAGEARLLLPQENLRSLPTSDFSLSLPDPAPTLSTGVRDHYDQLVSPIVQTSPTEFSGVELFPSHSPAYLILPVFIEPSSVSFLQCLYKDGGQSSGWQSLPKDSFRYMDGFVLLKTCCLHTFFTVVYREPLPFVTKRIRSRIGGSLFYNSKGPNRIKVKFSRGTCTEDTEAFLQILNDQMPGSTEREPNLACPIVMLGPHGFKVGPNKKMVEIELPIPAYREIMERCPTAELVVYESDTQEGKPRNWCRLALERHSIHKYYPIQSGYVSIAFGVYHFSFFKVVWENLSDMLYSVKTSASYFLPYVSFPMNCKAYMEENSEDNTFGMEVICFVDGTGADRMQHSNYRYCVGSNLKPKMVKPGRILVKLKSQKFEANVEAGEEEKMEKEEPDFRGRDFEKQFSCIFKKDLRTNIDRGTFGKVILDRVGENREKLENLFEFNLNKTGIETEVSPPNSNDRWSYVAIKELVGSLDLIEESKMKKFAMYIGFTT